MHCRGERHCITPHKECTMKKPNLTLKSDYTYDKTCSTVSNAITMLNDRIEMAPCTFHLLLCCNLALVAYLWSISLARSAMSGFSIISPSLTWGRGLSSTHSRHTHTHTCTHNWAKQVKLFLDKAAQLKEWATPIWGSSQVWYSTRANNETEPMC